MSTPNSDQAGHPSLLEFGSTLGQKTTLEQANDETAEQPTIERGA